MRTLNPGDTVTYREPVWDGPNGPLYTGTVEHVMPDMIRFEGGEFTDWSNVVGVMTRYCSNCQRDMLPEDDAWMTCPNAQDTCVDCCGEIH